MSIRAQNSSSSLYETYCNFYQENKGSVTNRLNNLCTMQGLSKIVNVSIPILKLAVVCGYNRFAGWIPIARRQRDLYQFCLLFFSLSNCSNDPTINSGLVLLESVSKTCCVLSKYEVFEFNTWEKISQNLSQLNFFNYTLMIHCLKKPRDFFILVTNSWNMLQINSLEKKDIFQAAFYIGNIALIIIRATVETQVIQEMGLLGQTYCFIELGVHTIGLVEMLIE